MKTFGKILILATAVLFLNVNSSITRDLHQKKTTVEICHKGKTMTINLSALISHLNHGDRLFACQ